MNRTTRRGFIGAGLGAGASLLGACTTPHAPAQPAPSAPSAPAVPAPDESPSEQPGRTPNTRFAVNVEMWWRKLPFLERLERAAELGFPAVEFWPWRGKDLDAIGARCRDLGLEVAQFTAWGFSPGMNDPANHAAVEAEIRESCAVARRLGCDRLGRVLDAIDGALHVRAVLVLTAGDDLGLAIGHRLDGGVEPGSTRAEPAVEPQPGTARDFLTGEPPCRGGAGRSGCDHL